MSYTIKNCRFGRGLFATRNIRKGDHILTMSGPIISQEQVDIKPDKEQVNALQIDEERYIDLQEPGVLGNHSCNPNAGLQEDTKLIAIKDIALDEEITYDYSSTVDGGWTMPCACGEKECRKKVKDFKLLPKEVQNNYLETGIVQKYIREKYKIKEE